MAQTVGDATLAPKLPAAMTAPITRRLDGTRVDRPGLGLIVRSNPGDGIAYVAELLQRTSEEIAGAAPKVVSLDQRRAATVGVKRQVRYFMRLLAAQWGSDPSWWLFAHVGIARAQRWVPRPLRKPYAVLLYGTEAWDVALSESRRMALRDARLRIAISPHTARRAMETHPDVGSVRHCLLGLMEPPTYSPAEVDDELIARLAVESVLIVGRMSVMDRYKGHDELLECWPALLERRPQAQLVVVGTGDDRERLQRKAGELGLGRNVLFTGFLSAATLDVMLHRVALFAMPSRGEGFGLVYIEAMRAGLPCIGSSLDAAEDVIVDGRTGFLVHPSDRAQLVMRIDQLLRNRELRNEMGRAGRSRFEAEFTYPRFRDRLCNLLVEHFAMPREGP